MKIQDIVVLGVVAILVGLALGYIIREKKRGAKCIGCSQAKTCSKKSCH